MLSQLSNEGNDKLDDGRGGVVYLGFRNLDDKDFKAILRKLGDSTPRSSSSSCYQQQDPLSKKSKNKKRRHSRTVGSTTKTTRPILSLLPNHQNVKSLNVMGNQGIGDGGMKYLPRLDRTMVQQLNLSDCGIALPGIQKICHFLKTNQILTNLSLRGNVLGDKGAALVADMLGQNKTLQVLCLVRTELGVVGFGHLSRGLANNDSLHELRLGQDDPGEGLGNEHIAQLCYPGLMVNQGLQTLHLGVTDITNQGLQSLEQVLCVNFFLQRLHILQSTAMINKRRMKTTRTRMRLSHDASTTTDDCILLQDGPESTWWKIDSWLELNRLNRKILLLQNRNNHNNNNHVPLSEWYNIFWQCHTTDNLDALYYFLCNQPNLLQNFCS